MKILARYQQASRPRKQAILDEFCEVTGYHRKCALRLLNGLPPGPRRHQRRTRRPKYPPEVIKVLIEIWKAAGYPWSVRLKALSHLAAVARRRFELTSQHERQLLAISPRQIDRRLKEHRRDLKKRLYGRTKPGTLLKHHIPLKTDHWNVTEPGFTEVDLVSHSGECADGEFIHSLNLTDIHTTWTETQAVLGKSQARVREALDQMRVGLPFPLRGIDSDNGSEFINSQLLGYCQLRGIQFTRGRPYKKDDNAHIEQKNWTHVRKVLGYVRYESPEALEAINELYRNELRLFQNLFLPSVKLLSKKRVGSKLRRVYDTPETPFERLLASDQADPAKERELKRLRKSLDPFALSQAIDRKLERIYSLARTRRANVPDTILSPHSPPSADHPWRKGYGKLPTPSVLAAR